MKNDFTTASGHAGDPFPERGTRMPITVLRRVGRTWQPIEATLLRTHLNTSVIGHARHPEYLLLRGHFEKHQTLPVMLGGDTYTVEKVSGMDNEGLPFVPGWR